MASPRSQISVLGHGLFGSALCDLLEDAGLSVTAWDPKADIPTHRVSLSIQEAVSHAKWVILAMPVEAQPKALETIQPYLSHQQIVLDVGSVKVHPERLMADCLGDKIPWVATHPLFGPASLARGERPLRVVVCPNPRHPSAVEAVENLFRAIGCTVIPQSAETHDQAMAEAHALGFFIAKGLLDTGASFESEVVPPSAQGLARLIHAVRIDAGHLLGTLNRQNPFAPALRKELIASLVALDEALEQGAPESREVEAELQIPDLGKQSQDLQLTRNLIDDVDRQILALLAQRARLSERAGAAKEAIGASVRDPKRESNMRQERRDWALELGLNPEGADSVFGAILRTSRARQLTELSDENE